MTQPPRHRLLERQLRRARGDDGTLDLDMLLDLVGDAYEEQDRGRRLMEHAQALTSRELAELNEQTRQAAAAQRRDAHSRMLAMLDDAVEGLVAVDREGRITAFNRASERMFGYAACEVMGQHLGFLFATGWSENGDNTLKRLAEAPLAQGLTEALESRGLRKSGEPFDAEITSTRIEVEGEASIIGLWRDVTARKAQQEALVRARNEAEAATRAKSEFLAAMSHEIRTPMNGVLGMASALQRTPLSDDQRRMVATINDSGRTLMTLLTDILDLSKIESGRLELEQTPFDFEACVAAVTGLYEEAAGDKGVSFRACVSEGARGGFLGDPTRIRQILQNLVSNALKFTEAGSVTLTAEVLGGPDGRSELRVEVADTGIGLSPEACGRLFQKFMQADASTTRRFGGSGLGLSICRELVSAMGGAIGVDSREGQGSRFWFQVPLARAVLPDGAEGGEAEAGFAIPAELRILVADDNATNRLVLKTLLSLLFETDAVYVEDGRQALDAVRDGAFDLVLMDVHMPLMDGLAAARAIRKLPGAAADVAIVAVSADAMSDQIARTRAAGMDGHVAKPLRPESLVMAIAEALAARPRQAAA